MKPEIEEYPSEDCGTCTCENCGEDIEDCNCDLVDEDEDWSDWEEFTDESVEFFDSEE